MRTGRSTLFYYTQMTTAQATTTTKSTFSPPATTTTPSSPWHSPVPYLFGGLAAMLGLIAFALLILACSYWNLSGQVNRGDSDVESSTAEKGENSSNTKDLPIFEEKYLVIMAGETKPTFLATPMSRVSSFHDEKVDQSNGKVHVKKTDQEYLEMEKMLQNLM